MTRARDISAAVSSSIFANYATFGQFNVTAGASYGTGFFKLVLNETAFSKNISLSSGSLLFNQTGFYNVNVGFRYGTSSDSWNGIRLFGNSTTVGTSFGTGNVTNDPGPVTFNLIARITNSAVAYDVQAYRAGGTWGPATPDVNAGRFAVVTINKVGEL
jgi:hypothetical protein